MAEVICPKKDCNGFEKNFDGHTICPCAEEHEREPECSQPSDIACPKCVEVEKIKINSLAMLKMEKNFRALEKGYSRQPYEKITFMFLLKRLKQEVRELEIALDKSDNENARCECADVSNITDYIFEKLSEGGGAR